LLLILFFGPDGSGKTTLARILSKFLRRRGLKVKISWMRGTHTFSSLLAKFLSRFAVFKGEDNPYYKIRIPSKFRRVWQFLEVVSALPVILHRFYFPRLWGRVIVSERSALDLIVWICMTTKDLSFLKSIYAKFLLSLTMRSGAGVYVRARPEVLVSRRRGELSFSRAILQLAVYNVLARVVGACVVDTSDKGPDESFKEVLGCLGVDIEQEGHRRD